MTDSNRKIMSDIYVPLQEWLEGNPRLEDSMKKELLDIVRVMITETIDNCYKMAMDTLGGKKK